MAVKGMVPFFESMNAMNTDHGMYAPHHDLLNKLNAEATFLRDQSNLSFGTVGTLSTGIRRGSLLGAGGLFDPLSLMNTPIIERRASLELSLARRMSEGLAVEHAFLAPLSIPASDFEISLPSNHKYGGAMMMGKQSEYNDLLLTSMKRRRSSLGLLGVLFDDSSQPLLSSYPTAASRRLSLLATNPVPPQSLSCDDLLLPQPVPSTKKHEEHIVKSSIVDDSGLDEESPTVRLDPSVDEVKLKATVLGFSKAMTQSQQSQQDIHDWDRKMGLKRSHSKTMRLSMRSRKKLKTLMKRDISQMVGAAA